MSDAQGRKWKAEPYGQQGQRTRCAPLGALAGAAALTVLGGATPVWAAPPAAAHHGSATATPIKHLVVLFDENISFDHYFATYPHAANTDGTKFTPSPRTPATSTISARQVCSTRTPTSTCPSVSPPIRP